MDQKSRTIYKSSLAYLFNGLNFRLKFDSLSSWTKFNGSITVSNFKL